MLSCSRCKEEKSEHEFQVNNAVPTKRDRYCRDCTRVLRRANYIREQSNPERAAKSRARKRNRDQTGNQLRIRYGISVEEYQKMLAAQGGVCAICQRSETKTRCGKLCRLAVDHSHTTGAIRGLLCNTCNTMLGNVRDNIDILQAAIEYLHNQPQERPCEFEALARELFGSDI